MILSQWTCSHRLLQQQVCTQISEEVGYAGSLFLVFLIPVGFDGGMMLFPLMLVRVRQFTTTALSGYMAIIESPEKLQKYRTGEATDSEHRGNDGQSGSQADQSLSRGYLQQWGRQLARAFPA